MNKFKEMFVILLFFGGVFTACDKPEKDVFNALSKLNVDLTDKQYVLLIPNAGCPGCTSSAESFMLMHLDSQEIVYVLTNFTSKKNISVKLGSDIFQYDNVIIDENNKFYNNNIMVSYPIVYTVRGGKSIIKIDTVSPYSPNTLADLESVILKE